MAPASTSNRCVGPMDDAMSSSNEQQQRRQRMWLAPSQRQTGLSQASVAPALILRRLAGAERPAERSSGAEWIMRGGHCNWLDGASVDVGAIAIPLAADSERTVGLPEEEFQRTRNLFTSRLMASRLMASHFSLSGRPHFRRGTH